VVRDDLLDAPPPVAARHDVILVGDLFYEQSTAKRALAFLARHAAVGTCVLVGDPGRAYLPRRHLEKCRDYAVPVTRELEDQDIKRTSVWRLKASE
jgi:predicted nicotinamide N-methyase